MNDFIVIGENKLPTKIAITDDEHEKGLMGVAWPPPIMTFAFDKSVIRKFWMKNTISPLDIIFCNAGKIISIYKGIPLSLKFVGPNVPTDLVIELPEGMVKERAIRVGQEVELKYSLRSMAKKFEVILDSCGLTSGQKMLNL